MRLNHFLAFPDVVCNLVRSERPLYAILVITNRRDRR